MLTAGSLIPQGAGRVARTSIILFLSGVLVAPTVCHAGQRATYFLRQGWQVRQLDNPRPDSASTTGEVRRSTAQWLETSVPAEVHEVLLRHHKIPDPRISKNAADSAWVGEKDWVYRCGFPTPKGNGGPVFLCFDGLDTLAEVTLNGRQIGRFNNMYRRYRVDVTGLLTPEEKVNHLLVVFSSPLRYVREIQVPDELKGVRKEHFLRKCHSDFGSYLGARPHSAKVGIFQDVYLDLPGSSWIDDVWIRPHLSADRTAAKIHVQVLVAGDPASLQLTLHDPAGKQAWATGRSRSNGTVEFEVDVNEPQLWWPRSHGSQPLYQLDAVISANGQPLDKRTVRFGIRDVRMVTEDPKTGEPRFRFDVNGQPIFLRGADLAPAQERTISVPYPAECRRVTVRALNADPITIEME